MKILSLIAPAFLLAISFAAEAANKPSEAEALVARCESNQYFFSLPFSRDKQQMEEVRANFKENLQLFQAFEFVSDDYSTVQFAPKQGMGLTRREISRSMKALLAEVELLLSLNGGSESGGIFCVTTSGLPSTF